MSRDQKTMTVLSYIGEQVYYRCILIFLYVIKLSLWLGLTVILYKVKITTNIRMYTVPLSPAYFFAFIKAARIPLPTAMYLFFRLCNTFFFSLHRLSECQCNFVVHKAAAEASEADLMSLRLIGKEKMSLLVFTPGSMRDPPNAAWRDDFWKRKDKTVWLY